MSTAKQKGRTFENLVQMVADSYAAQGIATLHKVDPPVAVKYRPGGRPLIIPKANPFLDFVGVWTARAGQALFIEAKSTEVPRLEFGNDGGIKASQLASLRTWSAAGAAVGVLWHYQGEVRLVTLGTIKATENTGRKSIPWASAQTLERGNGLVEFDFLAQMAYILYLAPNPENPE
jgi:penicillin-binding protein-related factor A (putative recombinase)